MEASLDDFELLLIFPGNNSDGNDLGDRFLADDDVVVTVVADIVLVEEDFVGIAVFCSVVIVFSRISLGDIECIGGASFGNDFIDKFSGLLSADNDFCISVDDDVDGDSNNSFADNFSPRDSFDDILSNSLGVGLLRNVFVFDDRLLDRQISEARFLFVSSPVISLVTSLAISSMTPFALLL